LRIEALKNPLFQREEQDSLGEANDVIPVETAMAEI
jgi:hypothetical protein